MLVTQQPVLRRFWYPVMPLAKLVGGAQAFLLLGQPLVLWLDQKGDPQAVEDRCCHRTAQLSLGHVQGDAIQCPYHGWQFDGSGVCIKVPQLDSGLIPKSYRVQSFGCAARYGYVWVCLDPPALQPIPEIPEAEDPTFRQIPQFDETWRCSGLRLMENSFDNAHPHFVHAKTFGIQQDPVPPQLDTFADHEYGLRVNYRLPVFNNPLQKANLGMADAAITVRISEGTWYLPFLRTLKITYPNGLVHLIFTSATPIDDQHSQVVQFCLRNDSEAQASAADIIAFDRAVTLEDQRILESTDFDTPLAIPAEEQMASDKPGIVMRRRLAALLNAHNEVEQRQVSCVTKTLKTVKDPLPFT